jgi:hypothetical protein
MIDGQRERETDSEAFLVAGSTISPTVTRPSSSPERTYGQRAQQTTSPMRREDMARRPDCKRRFQAGTPSTVRSSASAIPRNVSPPSMVWRASVRARRASTGASSSPQRSRRPGQPFSRGPTPSSRRAVSISQVGAGPRRSPGAAQARCSRATVEGRVAKLTTTRTTMLASRATMPTLVSPIEPKNGKTARSWTSKTVR